MIFYANGEPIPFCKDFHEDALMCVVDAEQKKLNIDLLKEDASFRELLDRWIRPCVEYMKSVDKTDWDVDELFFHETTNAMAFFNALYSCVRGYTPYDSDGNGAGRCPPMESILAEVDNVMVNTPEYMRLRVKVICAYLSSMPNKIFVNGDNWGGSFHEEDKAYLEVEQGQTFTIQLEDVRTLWPRELQNPSDQACTISVLDGKKTYPVTLPAGGSILALFADEQCTRLVNLKGNLFVVDARHGKIGAISKGGLYLCQTNNQSIGRMNTKGAFGDAAPDGRGSFVVRSSLGLTFLGAGRQIKKEPMRLYGTSELWAWQNQDFTLESNLDNCPDRAVSVAAGMNYIMVWDGTTAWKCWGVFSQKASRQDFVNCMMEPFVSSAHCESLVLKNASVSILQDGGVIFG